MKVTSRRKRIAGLAALATLGYGIVRNRTRIAKGVKQGRVALRDWRKKDEGPDSAPTEATDLSEVAAPAKDDAQTELVDPKDDTSNGGDK